MGSIGNALGGVGSAIGNFFSGNNNSSSLTAKMATGGIVTEPYTLVNSAGQAKGMIGEAGPEAVVPVGLGSERITPRSGSGGGSMQVTEHLTINIGEVASNASLDDIVTAIEGAVTKGEAQRLVRALSNALAADQQHRPNMRL